jgi:glycosyltransferase involved in cell wall biosynthesis
MSRFWRGLFLSYCAGTVRGEYSYAQHRRAVSAAVDARKERFMTTVCIVRQGYYPLDPRVTRQAKALVSIGNHVDVVCMRRPGEPVVEHVNGARVYRLPMRRHRRGKLAYLLEYGSFLFAATMLVAFRQLWRRYAVVQVNSLPDTLVFAALVPKWFGARVVLDLVECMPEFFSTKFSVPLDSLACRAIARAEQVSIGFSDIAITCTDQQKEAFVSRGAPPAKIGVVLNSSDESVFSGSKYPHKNRDRESKCFTLICHGSIEPRYGHDTVIHAIALLQKEIPGLRFVVYGDGSAVPDLRQLARELGVARQVTFCGYVPMDDLLVAISEADAGVVAMTSDAFRDLTHCHKMYDFISMEVPILMSRTRSVEAYFPPTCFQYFNADDPGDLARAIRELQRSPELAASLVEQATRTNSSYRWSVQRVKYLDIIQPLLGQQRRGREVGATRLAQRFKTFQ